MIFCPPCHQFHADDELHYTQTFPGSRLEPASFTATVPCCGRNADDCDDLPPCEHCMAFPAAEGSDNCAGCDAAFEKGEAA